MSYTIDKFKFECEHNSKYPFTLVGIVWKTRQEAMLRGLLSKFLANSVPDIEYNSRLGIIDYRIGRSGIIFKALYKKVLNIIAILNKILLTANTNVNGNMKELRNDVSKGATVYVSGNSKRLIAILSEGNENNKVNAFIDKLNVEPKIGAEPAKKINPTTCKLKCVIKNKSAKTETLISNKNKFDLMRSSRCICPVWFEGNYICSPCEYELRVMLSNIPNKLYKICDYSINDSEIMCKMYGHVFSFTPEGSDDNSEKVIGKIDVNDS